jgi:hypothetical protein
MLPVFMTELATVLIGDGGSSEAGRRYFSKSQWFRRLLRTGWDQ